MSDDNVNEFLKLEEYWCGIKSCEIYEGLNNEKNGIKDILKNYKFLGISGGLLKIDEMPVAFTLGEKLSDEMILIHVEKALADYIGAYQAINQFFLEKEYSNFSFVNREEDLGIDSLRKTKLAYNPIRFLNKYFYVLK